MHYFFKKLFSGFSHIDPNNNELLFKTSFIEKKKWLDVVSWLATNSMFCRSVSFFTENVSIFASKHFDFFPPNRFCFPSKKWFRTAKNSNFVVKNFQSSYRNDKLVFGNLTLQACSKSGSFYVLAEANLQSAWRLIGYLAEKKMKMFHLTFV